MPQRRSHFAGLACRFTDAVNISPSLHVGPSNTHLPDVRGGSKDKCPDIMKKLLILLGTALLFNGSLRAQEPAPEPMIAAAARFDASQLDQLLGPIALYPDALIALILPA